MIFLDSNILISAYSTHTPSIRFMEKTLNQTSVGISIITATEIYAGIKRSERAAVRAALADFTIVPFDQNEIAELAADYKSQFGLKIPDAIILATCEFHGSQFYTYDQDFKKTKKSWVHVLKFES